MLYGKSIRFGVHSTDICLWSPKLLPLKSRSLPPPAARGHDRTQMAPDPAANRADLIDRLLVGFVNVPAGVVLPMIGAIVSIMFYYFNNHMFR